MKSWTKGFQYFPSDQITDHPERFLVSEMVREKVLHLTREEIPHSVPINGVDSYEAKDKVHIRTAIMVERDSPKSYPVRGGAILEISSMAVVISNLCWEIRSS